MNQNTYNTDMQIPIKAQWVAGKFFGEQAKVVQSQADAGIGYFVLERPEKGSSGLVAAFRRPIDSITPEHLSIVSTKDLLNKLERMHEQRTGVNRQVRSSGAVGISSMFPTGQN